MAKTWGVPGKRQTYLSPGEQIAKMPKVPLNANPLLSWDYKKSKYRRIDLYPKAVSENTQQGGVIPVTASAVPLTPTPTPSLTPTNTPTPSSTTTPTPTTTTTPTVTPTPSMTPAPSYFQFTVTSGATAQDACGSSVTFTIYTYPFDDSACSADLSGWACMPQNTESAFIDPELTIEIGNGFYASEYQTGVVGSYEFAGAFSNWSICPMVWSDADIDWNNESGTWDTV